MGHELTSLQREVISGLTAGTITTIASHPLDLLKLRLQLSAGNRANTTYTGLIRDIFERQQWGRELYRGLGVNLLGNSVAWALYFGCYRCAKDIALRHLGNESATGIMDRRLPAHAYMLAAGSSGIATAVLTNPIWVIKTRIMATSRAGPYKSTFDGVYKLYQTEGVLAFWRGVVPSLLGVSQGAIYFALYDTLKFHYLHSSTDKAERRLSVSEIIGITCISKMISVTSVYPFQLLKSKLQDFGAPSGITQLVQTVYSREGIRGFYRGLSANLLRAVPATCITFFVYENIKYRL
ncbi:AER366Wp [Eremothecium gossypii ATCC 10895]|uniref:AER366Wp n=1 Tax=Eremothecium gossypii (strain ATCC 10895 / CBS 109.51 / FGSC 9923 / NRRL Y-1056) TaxID=284811 RepID=Q756A1_EREGS|nr:AER366Wp [Eremothecium gossypii ATCC 10895]AAS53046.1 AER366Wp [Eremothecium gossypii ATCC 10895]AEY97354.1 FAER366Wp [Eremothecium gossypii FDAG1]